MEVQRIDCAIIDDEIYACDRLKNILNSIDNIDIVGVYSTFQEAIEGLLIVHPKLIFLDVELDKSYTAFELIDQLHSNAFFPSIILVTAYEHYWKKQPTRPHLANFDGPYPRRS